MIESKRKFLSVKKKKKIPKPNCLMNRKSFLHNKNVPINCYWRCRKITRIPVYLPSHKNVKYYVFVVRLQLLNCSPHAIQYGRFSSFEYFNRILVSSANYVSRNYRKESAVCAEILQRFSKSNLSSRFCFLFFFYSQTMRWETLSPPLHFFFWKHTFFYDWQNGLKKLEKFGKYS